MNYNSIEAYNKLVSNDTITKQEEQILKCLVKGQIISTYELVGISPINRIDTVGARCNGLAKKGLLIPVGRKQSSVTKQFYTTYRLANNRSEVERVRLARQQASKKKPLDKILNGNYSKSLKSAVEAEIDRINQSAA